MAEEDIVTYPVEPSDHKRKLEDVESEVLEQQAGSLGRSNEVSLVDGDKGSDYSQAKRPKLEDEAADGIGIEKTQESVGKDDSGEERTEESKDEGTGKSTLEELIHVEESGSKIDNGMPEDNQPAFVEVAISQEVSVQSMEVKEVDDSSKEANDAIAQKDIENESKEANNGGSQKEDANESKEANADGSDHQKETRDETKEVNGSGSHEEIGDESKEVNGGGSHKEVDETQSMTRRIDVPSSKVGTLIGRGGEMVRQLQINSGAKIQIRRDAEADPNSALRPVEIIGNLASIEKAEKLINTVIAETEAGGVPSLFARAVSEQMEIKVPNDKVGVIIGRGGETIKNMQTKSRARIQLIPQNEGDGSKERTVRISGDKRQIDIATSLIQDVMYQDARPSHPSHYSGGFNQPAYQPRGLGGPPQWDSRGPHGPHSMPYNYHHGGPYPSQGSHFRPPNSGGYPSHHMPPRSGYGSSWEQRPPHTGPYEYYGRQGAQAPGPVPPHVAPYSQPGPQQTYGHTYDQPNYDNPPMQQSHGGYGVSQQSYPPAGGQHQMQQPGRPYGMQGSAEQGYGPPRPAAPSGDPYQGPTQAAPSYGTSMAPQQQYGYASSAPGQQTYPSYNSAAPSDGYNGTQAPAIAPAYEQHAVQPASGVQQTSAAYGQVPPTGGYSSYPSTQPAYGSTTQPAYGSAPAQSNGNYGYGSQYPSYGGGNASAYAAPVGQTAYSQTAPVQAGYEQSATPSAGYAAAPGTAQ
ncbi:unnamed protein product [Arabis nemorensis]|uniref:K Homology domain-containing protein n=1 Tax=Arabis nemorensis TaxID=586526 RepID=A0A565CDT1_9BRAS|nr:unnamed protein product [Arabis nemorensis]